MPSALNNDLWAPAGVWRFGNDKKITKSERLLATAINVAGWIPVVGIIAGIASVTLGLYFLTQEEPVGVTLCVRGAIQALGLGLVLLAPCDIVCSVIRAWRTYHPRIHHHHH